MNEILNGAPQFILLILTTGMIAFYSLVLNKVIKKKKKRETDGLKADVRLAQLSKWLVTSEIVLLLDDYLILIRIILAIFMWTSPMLDLITIAIFAFSNITLFIVFCISYFSKESWKLVW